jgi:VanZ family protein
MSLAVAPRRAQVAEGFNVSVSEGRWLHVAWLPLALAVSPVPITWIAASPQPGWPATMAGALGSSFLASIPANTPGSYRHGKTIAYAAFVSLLFLNVHSGIKGSQPQAVQLASLALLAVGLGAGVWAASRQLRGGGTLERPCLWFLATVVFALLMGLFSGSAGGADPMLEFARNVLGLSPDAAEFAVVAARKGLHFLAYGALAWLAFRAARVGRADLRASLAIALGFALTHASYDEIIQAGSPQRSGSIFDVLLDFAGMAAFVAFAVRVESSRQETLSLETRTLEQELRRKKK